MKIGLYLALVLALLGGIKWGYGAIYDAGWNAAVVEQETAIQQARDKAIQETETVWKQLVDEAEAQIVVEEKLVEVIREVEKEIPVVVEKIVTIHPECNDLGPDFVRLWNEQASAGANIGAESAGDTAVTDP